MGQIDGQMITLYKIEDTDEIRAYSAVSGGCTGIAQFDKKNGIYSYEGDSLGKFTEFVKHTLSNSVALSKDLPAKIVHGFG